MTMYRQIILNQIKTPDGTILTSRDRHDFKHYEDPTTNEVYICDGGKDYLKRSVNIIPYKELSVYNDDSFETIREAFTWGTYGKSGKSPLKIIELCNMSNDHIHAILNDIRLINNPYIDLFKQEMEYRKDNEILIKDRE